MPPMPQSMTIAAKSIQKFDRYMPVVVMNMAINTSDSALNGVVNKPPISASPMRIPRDDQCLHRDLNPVVGHDERGWINQFKRGNDPP